MVNGGGGGEGGFWCGVLVVGGGGRSVCLYVFKKFLNLLKGGFVNAI